MDEKKKVTKKTTTKKKTVKPTVKQEAKKTVEEVITETKEAVKQEEKKVVKKATAKKSINLKNKKEATKALSKTTKQSAKAKQASKKKVVKKDPLKDVNIIKPIKEEVKTEPKKESKKELKRKDKKLKKEEKKRSKEKTEKTKLVLPKEWTKVSDKKKSEKKEKEFSDTNTLTDIFKRSLFEEVDEQQYQEQKKVKKKKRKKNFLIFLIIVAAVFVIGLILIKYNDTVKKTLAVYDPYKIGDKVKLKDKSVWYVIEDSDAHEDTVRLLKEGVIDFNDDNKIDNKDRIKYNANNKAEYDPKVKNSVAYYLENEYRKKLEDKVGSVEEVTILETKEYVRVRRAMNFPDEWSQGNWLASSSLGYWWIISELNSKVFVVAPNGTFKLYSANSYNKVRPVIEIKKESILKEEKPKEETKETQKKD